VSSRNHLDRTVKLLGISWVLEHFLPPQSNFNNYSLNHLIDMEGPVVLDVEATPTQISKEVDASETMNERTEERFDLKPKLLAGDVAYRSVTTAGSGYTLPFLTSYRCFLNTTMIRNCVRLGPLHRDKS
jgi:hypothetical protein